MTRLSEIVAPSFRDIHEALVNDEYTHYWCDGGRASTKSSWVSVEIPLGIMRNPGTHAVVMRRYATTLRGSVYAQILWGIDMLDAARLWKATVSPMRLTYVPTGQTIVFLGADDPLKIKSIKFREGYSRYVWFEELNEFQDMDSIRNILQSLMRGGPVFSVFYTYNPPVSVQSWANQEAMVPAPGRVRHHSTYLDVPPEWLGEQFLIEAEHLKRARPDRYEHEYLGVPTGTGGEVFRNVTVRAITREERARFAHPRDGVDFGYATDPLVWLDMEYDKTRRRLFLSDEVYGVGMKLRDLAADLKRRGVERRLTVCDSAEPRSIDELREHGVRAVGAEKGPGSRDYGLKWLADLEEIIIDPGTCPNAAREFIGYELEADRNGVFKSKFPDANDHCIDAARYACEGDMKLAKARAIGGKPAGW